MIVSNQKKECRCWLDYPNKNMKRDKYWRCVDDYECVKKRTEKTKTICRLKMQEGEKHE